MSSPASIKGHPIHPMLVGVPIGLWTFALVADLVYKLGLGDESWARTAFLCIGGGIVGALLAAVPGLFDLLSLSDPRAKVRGFAELHMRSLDRAIAAEQRRSETAYELRRRDWPEEEQ